MHELIEYAINTVKHNGNALKYELPTEEPIMLSTAKMFVIAADKFAPNHEVNNEYAGDDVLLINVLLINPRGDVPIEPFQRAVRDIQGINTHVVSVQTIDELIEYKRTTANNQWIFSVVFMLNVINDTPDEQLSEWLRMITKYAKTWWYVDHANKITVDGWLVMSIAID